METGKKYFESDETDEILSAEILEFAHNYQSNDFPNPQRKGCPAKEDLLKTANSIELPKAELREHLLSCSPCFLEFHAARKANDAVLAMNENEISEKKSSWFAFLMRPLPVAAFLIFFCILTGIFLYAWGNRNNTETAKVKNVNQSEQVSENQPVVPNEANLLSENKATNPAESPKQNNPAATVGNKNSKAVFEDESKTSAKKTINLNLATAAVLRNKSSSETVYSLPSQTIALNVKLRASSPAGDYEVSLLDETGKPLVKSLTKKSDGKNLRVELNLRNNPGRRARLCIAPKGEIPDCFAVSIGSAD